MLAEFLRGYFQVVVLCCFDLGFVFSLALALIVLILADELCWLGVEVCGFIDIL